MKFKLFSKIQIIIIFKLFILNKVIVLAKFFFFFFFFLFFFFYFKFIFFRENKNIKNISLFYINGTYIHFCI